jgi:hypothetical protein
LHFFLITVKNKEISKSVEVDNQLKRMKKILGLIVVLATVSVAQAQAVNPNITAPEPATLTLLVLGAAALGLARFRRKP